MACHQSFYPTIGMNVSVGAVDLRCYCYCYCYCYHYRWYSTLPPLILAPATLRFEVAFFVCLLASSPLLSSESVVHHRRHRHSIYSIVVATQIVSISTSQTVPVPSILPYFAKLKIKTCGIHSFFSLKDLYLSLSLSACMATMRRIESNRIALKNL